MFIKKRKRNTVIQLGGRISGIIYSLTNGWAYIRGALKWDFTVVHGESLASPVSGLCFSSSID